MVPLVRSKKDQTLRRIIKKIREKPVRRIDFPDVRDSTYYDNEQRAIRLGIAKKLDDGRLAWIDFESLEEEILNLFQKNQDDDVTKSWVSGSARIVAEILGWPENDPKFQKAYWKAHRKFYPDHYDLIKR